MGATQVLLPIKRAEGQLIQIAGTGTGVLGDPIVRREVVALLPPLAQYIVWYPPSVAIIEVGVSVIALQNGELGAIDRDQLVGGDSQTQSNQRIDLHKGLPSVRGHTKRYIRIPLLPEARQ